MSRVKNVSGGSLDVPILNRSVEDGEVVDVPDFQAKPAPRRNRCRSCGLQPVGTRRRRRTCDR